MKGDIEMESKVPNSKKFKTELANAGLTRKDAVEQGITTIEEIKKKRNITGNVKLRKKSKATRFKDVFFPGDTEKVKSFIVKDVIIPTIVKAIDTIITDGVHMMLYGETEKKNGRPADSMAFRDYRDYSSKKSPDSRYERSRDYRSSISKLTYEYEDVEFEYRKDAENVLMGMDDILKEYGIVRVADYYELVQVDFDHTATNYGWYDLRTANIIRTNGGYRIKLPRPLPID